MQQNLTKYLHTFYGIIKPLLIHPSPLAPRKVPKYVVNFSQYRRLPRLNNFIGRYAPGVFDEVVRRLVPNGIHILNLSTLKPLSFQFHILTYKFVISLTGDNISITKFGNFINVSLLQRKGDTEMGFFIEGKELVFRANASIQVFGASTTKKNSLSSVLLFDFVNQYSVIVQDPKVNAAYQIFLPWDQVKRIFKYPLSVKNLPCDTLLVENAKILSLMINASQIDFRFLPLSGLSSGYDKFLGDILFLFLQTYQNIFIDISDHFVGTLGIRTANEFIQTILSRGHQKANSCSIPFPKTFSEPWRLLVVYITLIVFLFITAIVVLLLSWSNLQLIFFRKILYGIFIFIFSLFILLICLVFSVDLGLDALPNLAYSLKVPWWLRITVPTILFLLIVGFVASNVGLGAVVEVKTLANTTNFSSETIFPPIFTFDLFGTVVKIWDAGVYPLSVLVLLFSGIWPYVKLALLFVIWLIPIWYLSHFNRHILLVFLDALGKWSLLDTYVLVMMMAGFHFDFRLGPILGFFFDLVFIHFHSF